MRFSLTTLGCKVNQYDGQAVAALLGRSGLLPAAGQDADLLVINTCCVTGAAMRKSRQAIRRAVRDRPAAAVLVLGCYGDYDRQAIRAVLAECGVSSGASLIAGHHGDLAADIPRFVEGLRRRAALPADGAAADEPALAGTIRTRRLAAVKRGAPGAANLPPIDGFPSRQRAFVKVQDGCDAFCSYCIVPYTRPVVRCRREEDILQECRALVAAGHKEIVLCGVFLGAFGRDTAVRSRWGGKASVLPRLLRRVAALEGLWRVRLSSLEPGDLTDDLLAALRDLPAAARHLHLPLQSASARVLRLMNRQYSPDEYYRTVDRLRSTLDRPSLTTDVIVGFPGEAPEDFQMTLAAARYAGFAKIHAFPFSAIRGTAAWDRRAGAASPAVVRERMAELAAVERELAAAYRRQFVGETMEGLVERARASSPGLRQAMTDRYLRVEFAAPPRRLTGQIVRFGIDGVSEGGLTGTLAEGR
jgi:threonylcarbamoyladenosine tRNA methylthiotransferase MtaB